MKQQWTDGQWAHLERQERVVAKRTAEALGLKWQELSQDERGHYGRIETENVWIRQSLPPWCAMLRVVRSPSGSPVVAEVRVFPQEDELERAEAGLSLEEWSGCHTGYKAVVPAAGLTARLLRGVKIGSAIRGGIRKMPWFTNVDPEVLVDPSFWAAPVRRHGSRVKCGGRRRLPDQVLARLAYIYIKNQEFPNPNVLTARVFRITQSQVRDRIRLARERGLLSRTESTRAGGTLTAKGRQLLETAKAGRTNDDRATGQEKGGRNP